MMQHHSMLTRLLLVAFTASQIVAALPSSILTRELPKFRSHCPPFEGNFIIEQYKLYPENADFDFKRCVLYLGCLWNATVGVYDPYQGKMIEILEFPGISHNNDLHIGGVGVDQKTGLLSVVVDAAAAFITAGSDISGTNWIIQWDPVTRKTLYQRNLTDTVHGKYGGYQDVEQDPEGNVFIVGTYPGSILKVSKDGKKVIPWYLSPPGTPSTTGGYGGLAAKDWMLLANDVVSGEIYKFDMSKEKGAPKLVPHYPNTTISLNDAIYFPPKYGGTVLLVAENFVGISVLRSKDGKWNWAEYLGVVPNLLDGTLATAPVQVGDGLYIVAPNFNDPIVPGTTSGNRTVFPFVDITAQVETLLLAK